jgi:UDP-N-acetylglucosamine--N-acetylmuramyl-(pentapeptide) pyrophosphoryl-undecaprenol N-acetylglucosamine transferase
VGKGSFKNEPQRLLIAAGGTGGHVFPGLAVADYVKKEGLQVEWLGGETGLEQKLVTGRYPLHTLPMIAFRGSGVLHKLKAVGGLCRAFLQARRILRRRNACVVLVMGGYVSAPVGLAAKSLGIPLILHEQNAISGMANRYLSALAAQIFEAFPNTYSASDKVVHSGNPLRESFYTEPAISERDETMRILVMGGSQGAQSINEVVAQTIPQLPSEHVAWWHQTGAANYERYQAAYVGQPHVRCEAFIDDTAEAFAWADLVISRAGALSVSEIAASGVGSILIPFPYAVDDHQYHNAKHLEALSAALIVRQKDLTAELLIQQIRQWLDDPHKLFAMGRQAKRLAMPNATRAVADYCLQRSKVCHERV